MNDYDYLVNQLNLLVGFLEVSDQQVYNQIKQHDRFNIEMTIEQLYEYQYSNYSNHIVSAALLIGFAHFEDFVTKCIARYLTTNPDENQLKITLKRFKELGGESIPVIASEQSKRMTFSEKLKFIKEYFTNISDGALDDMRFVNNIRNCLMHNNGRADDRLMPRYNVGEKIILEADIVNSYGLKTIQLACEIWDQI